MRIDRLLVLGMLFVSCSAPKFTYNFDYYGYNAGKKSGYKTSSLGTSIIEDSLLLVKSGDLITSTEAYPSTLQEHKSTSKIVESELVSSKKDKKISSAERRKLRYEIRKEIKQYRKVVEHNDIAIVDETPAMSIDLKLAIIFGAIGLTLGLLGALGDAFLILGVLAIVIGVVFLIKWLVRQ